MKKILRCFLSVCIAFFFTGCAGNVFVPGSSESQIAQSYRKRALVFEKDEEWQMALYCWKIADSLTAIDKETAIKIADLTKSIKQKSEKHFNKGIVFYRNNNLKQARYEFYQSIKIDPDNSEAVIYLKKIHKGENYKTSNAISKKSDIAASEKKNDSIGSCDKNLSPIHSKAAKNISVKKPKFKKPQIDIEKKLVKGSEFLNAGEYDKAIGISEEILKQFSLNRRALDLANSSYYQKGVALYMRKEHRKALSMFRNVEPGYKDVKDKISRQIKVLKDQANRYYRKGVKFYIEENFKKAIIEWEKTLQFDPAHEEAKRDIIKASQVLEKLNSVK